VVPSCSAAIFVSPKPFSGNGIYTSDAFTPVQPGTYLWVASYNGDTNNNPATTACGDPGETSTVTKTSPTMTTHATSATVGGTISDTATFAGAVSPTGSISFTLYGPNNATCTGTPAFTSTNPVSGNGSTSGSFTTVSAGTYSWIASYIGDTNNSAATTVVPMPSHCGCVRAVW